MNRLSFFLIAGSLLTFFVLLYSFSLFTEPFIPHGQRVQQATPTPSPTLSGQKEIELVGWYSYWDEERSLQSLRSNIHHLDTFSPMLYRVMPDGSLGKHRVDTRKEVLQLAKEHNIPIAPAIGDESDYKRIRTLLYDPSVREQFTAQLIEEAKKENFVGWVVDIEVLQSTDRVAFSSFVEELARELHANALKLFVVVFGRTERESYDPALAHDYRALGRFADQVQLMIYGYHSEFTGPGGQTPLDWYRTVLAYAINTIPRDKILAGLSTHGYDWSDNSVEGLTFPEVDEILSAYKAQLSYDQYESSAVSSYKEGQESHTLWFEDAQTITEKVRIARDEFGISTFALWRIGAEDPTVWEKIRDL